MQVYPNPTHLSDGFRYASLPWPDPFKCIMQVNPYLTHLKAGWVFLTSDRPIFFAGWVMQVGLVRRVKSLIFLPLVVAFQLNFLLVCIYNHAWIDAHGSCAIFFFLLVDL